MPSTTMTIDQLELSPHNVRTNRQDMLNTAAIERSLLTTGQMFPLLVHPWRGRSDRFGVFAGGRRWRSFKNLIGRGELPRDQPIDVVVRDLNDAELTEISLAENLLRRDLRPYEEYAAVLKAHRRKATPDQIAKATGQELIWVNKALRLAQLAPPLLAALETDRLSVAQAQAFAATEDHAAQVAAWTALCGTGDAIAAELKPAQIRTALKVGDPELTRLLAFVGDASYREAGGRFELDLFADQAEQRGRIADEPVLRGLVDAKLAEVRAEARARAGREVRFQAKPPQTSYNTADHALEIAPTELDNDTIALPNGDVVGTIAITPAGTAEVRWWWASATAKRNATAKKTPKANPAPVSLDRIRDLRTGVAINDAASPGAKREADAAMKEDTGLGQESVEIMRTLRRAIFRAALIEEARNHRTWALDYFVWAQLRTALRHDDAVPLGVQPLNQDRSAAALLGQDIVRATRAHQVWQEAIEQIRNKPAINSPDLETAFHWYAAQPAGFKRVAEAIVAGMAFERTLAADGYDLPVPASIAANVDLDDMAVRVFWEPTPELLGRIPRSDQLAIAEPFLERVTFGAWQRLKGPELTRHLHELLTGAGAHAKASVAEAARRWVHPLLRFSTIEPIAGPDDGDEDDDRQQTNDVVMLEAAE